MHRHFPIILLFLATTIRPAAAQREASEFQSLFTALAKDKIFNGNVLIAEKGKVIYQHSFGDAEIGRHARKLDANSVFELASVSKQFTAMGIIMLKERGLLSYDDSLRKYFPELPYSGITILHLLHHTSGLPDYMDIMARDSAPAWDPHRIATNNDMIAVLAKEKPETSFAPGEKYEYCNTGYALLASIIEKVSGKSYGAFLEENIFRPLGMTHSLVYNRRLAPHSVPDYALGYVFDTLTKRPALPDSLADFRFVYFLDGIVGDGTVNSTAGDLLKWDQALYTNKLIRKETLAEAFKPAVLNDGKASNYGFGWEIERDTALGAVLSHSGGWPGYNTYIERYIDSDKTFILLDNMSNEDRINFVPAEVRRIFHGVPAHYTMPAANVDSKILTSYVGRYQGKRNLFEVTQNGSQLSIHVGDQKPDPIVPRTSSEFIVRTVDAEFTFVSDSAGAVTELVLHQNGRDYHLRRL